MTRGGTPGAIALRGAVCSRESAASRDRRLHTWIMLAVAGAAVLGGTAALVVQPGGAVGRATTHRRGLLNLPLVARGPVSAALGGDDRAYRVRDLRAVNRAQRLHVGFSTHGVTVSSGRARLGVRLSAYGYANRLQSLPPLTPLAHSNRVSYLHGSLREWYANGPLGLEQGFDVAARPRTGIGPLTFSLTISGNLTSRLEKGSLLLSRRGVELRYGGLMATDARGRVLRSWLRLVKGHVLIRVDDRRAVYPLRIDPFFQAAELTANGGNESERGGYSVAVSGDTIVVGAPGHNVGSSERQGAVYVFEMPSSGWANATQTATLSAAGGSANNELGWSVAISGDTIAASAPFRYVKREEQGVVYVYAMPATGWADATQNAELTASDGGALDFLGWSLAISGNTIVAGAPNHDLVNEHGAVYVFEMPSTGWSGSLSQSAELSASAANTHEQLGYSVALSGDTIVAGAPKDTVGTNATQGAAYVFQMPSTGWSGPLSQSAELTASDGEQEDELGRSIAIAGNTVVAGAPRHDVGADAEQGAAYVFQMPSTGWSGSLSQSAELTATGGETEDYFGDSVAIMGDKILAGAPFLKVGGNGDQGAVYLFMEPASGWSGSVSQSAELTATGGAPTDWFGTSVAAAGGTIVAGAPKHKVGAVSSQGAAYAFTAPSPSVTISSPANGATYTQGQAVPASYSCGAPAGASVVACAGPVASGAAIETSALGAHTFTVNAVDSDGLTVSQSATYTVVAVPIALPVAPVIGALSETAKTWREGSALARVSRRRKPKTLPVGTTFSFSLNEAASVTFTFTEPAGGRKVGRSCVAQSKKNRKKRRCTRTVIAGALTFTGHAGENKVRFDGLITKHKRLGRGSYTLLVTSTASGKRSSTRTLHFTIVA